MHGTAEEPRIILLAIHKVFRNIEEVHVLVIWYFYVQESP